MRVREPIAVTRARARACTHGGSAERVQPSAPQIRYTSEYTGGRVGSRNRITIRLNARREKQVACCDSRSRPDPPVSSRMISRSLINCHSRVARVRVARDRTVQRRFYSFLVVLTNKNALHLSITLMNFRCWRCALRPKYARLLKKQLRRIGRSRNKPVDERSKLRRSFRRAV